MHHAGGGVAAHRPSLQLVGKRREDLIMCRKLPGVAIGRLCEKCDGERVDQSYIGTDRAMLRYVLPLAEVVAWVRTQ